MSQDDVDSSVDNSKADEEILRVAHERFKIAVDAEVEIRKLALEDIEFSVGEQWPDEIKRMRDLDKRPCLTINRLPQFIHQITNDQRQNRPSIKVSPVDDKADVDTAKIFQGLIRHIEYASDADTAYDTAFDSAVRASFGYFRIVTEFANAMAFEQDIKIKRIPNRFSVYLDPSHQNPDGSDANWGFVFDDVEKDQFKAEHPKAKQPSMDGWEDAVNQRPIWFADGRVRVAEYFYKEYRSATVCLLSNKDTVEKDHLPKDENDEIVLPAGIAILQERETLIPEVKWCKINGIEILEKTDWLGKWIPIIPVIGEEVITDGKKVLSGVVRHAKDSQRMYNVWTSAETELIALAPKAPFLGAEGQFEGHEEQWKTANVRNHAYLQYKAKNLGGILAPPPQRQTFEPPTQAITQAKMLAADDLKATTGIYDAALGNQARETSGVAIQRRNSQTQTSNFHFVDNLTKSIRHAGRILIDLIPKVYDTARAVRTLGEDGTEKIVQINQIFQQNGKDVSYMMDRGRYDVTVSTGPSFETKRQEAVQSMLDLTRSMPQFMQSAGDLLVKNMDWPGADEIAERLRKMLPPNLVDDDKNAQPVPPQAQAMLQQLSKQNAELIQHLNQKTQLIENKALELESKERISFAQIQAEIQITLAKLGSQEALAQLDHQVGQIESRLSRLHENQSIQQEIEAAQSGAELGAATEDQPNQQPAGGQPAGGHGVQ